MGLVDDLKQLAEQVRKRQAHVKGEEATKQALILPFLQALGYDIYDPTEIKPEYVADFATKKAGQFEKVDYAISLGGKLSIFVECKASDVPPEDHSGQLSRYFNATPSVRVGIVGNGIRYRFHTDLRAPNIMDSEAFFEFDILGFSDRDIEILRPFTKEAFNSEAVQGHAQELIFIGKVTGLVNELLRNPSENFCRFLLKELDLVAGPLTGRVVERFVPIVKKSIQTTLLDMMTRSLQQQISLPAIATPEQFQPTPAPVLAPVPVSESIASQPRATIPIETTAEEMEIFKQVQKLCGESSIKREIGWKDSTSYFAIHAGRITWWFLRIFTNNPERKNIATRLTVEQATLLAPGFKVEAAPESIGKSRVYISGASDIDRLRALVMVAYEEEAKQHEGKVDEAADGADLH